MLTSTKSAPLIISSFLVAMYKHEHPRMTYLCKGRTRLENDLGDNCIQIFHLGRYIGNLVLRRRVSGAVKRDFRTYIRRYTSPMENFEYGYPHSNALLTFSLQKDSENVLCCAYTSSDVSCIKPLASCIYSLVNQ